MNSPNELGRPEMVDRYYEDDDEIDLLHYWHIVNRYKWSIAGLTGVVCLFAYVVTAAMTPIYQSTATLLIESQEANVVSIEEVYGIDASQREYYQTQFEILNSRKLAEVVIRQLNLQSHPEYDPDQRNDFSLKSFVPFLPEAEPPNEAQRWQSIVGRFRDNLSIEPVLATQLVDIHFESEDAALAPQVA
ncbi:MAG: Wzz/FepE/Etk N-terminal domain-containing protein, partial [Pseudomonadales bacterium]